MRKGTWAGLALALALVVGLLAARAAGLQDLLTREHLQAVLAPLGPWAPAGFMAIKVVTIVLALPSAPVTITGGLLFGAVWGTVVNVLAATAGASLTYFIGRAIGREEVERRLHGRLKELDDGLGENGLSFMLFLRLVPLFPFNGINYGAGLTRISFRDYLLGTFFGIMPGATVFTLMGAAAAEGDARLAVFAFAGLGLLALLPVLLKRWRRAVKG